MKDAKGHGSNTRGAQGKPIYNRSGFRDPATLSGKNKDNAFKADATAHKAMAAIDNGIHSGSINSLPSLQRRHYENIAATLADQGKSADPSSHSQRISAYADRLSTTNPLFNRQRFIEAASGKRK